MIGLEHQHGRRFIVLEHQNGRRDVMWKRSIVDLFIVKKVVEMVVDIVLRRE